MSTSLAKAVDCKLVTVGDLELEDDNHDPGYRGLVVSGDMIIIVDRNAKNVQLHRRNDGKLLAKSDQLKSGPCGICQINDTEICVILYNSTIEIISVQCTGDTGVLTRVRTLHVKPTFYYCTGIVKFMDKVVVCGKKHGMISWCIVSLNDGHVQTTHQICKGSSGNLTTKHNMIYVSCRSDYNSPENGVYGYNIQNPTEQKFIYKHQELMDPRGITVDAKGFIFVCNWLPPRIHCLTDRCQLVTIYSEGIPTQLIAIFCDLYQELLYVTSMESTVITLYNPVYEQGVPIEILNMDDRSIQLFEEALKAGKENVYYIRVMVVGHLGVGKTTLIKRLLGKEVNISDRHSTEGIDVHVNCCDVSLSTFKWTQQDKDKKMTERKEPKTSPKSGSSPNVPPAQKSSIKSASHEKSSDLENFEWYYKGINRQESETVLRDNGNEGCFMVRDSSSPGIYAVSLFSKTMNRRGQVHHYRVNKSMDNKFYLVKELEFNTILELVDYHKLYAGGLICCLGNPPIRNKDDIVTTSIGLDSEQNYLLRRLSKVLNEQQSMRDKVANEAQAVIFQQGERTRYSHEGAYAAVEERTPNKHEGSYADIEDKDTEVLHNFSPTASQQEKAPTALLLMKHTQYETNTMNMLKLLQENADKLKPDAGKNSLLTVWDFAGQYAFYTTHQTFLTRRAIYLLVSDVSGQVTDLVADECYFDSEGTMKCKVHELIEVWLNSIHSCAPSPEAGIPPVILVGTHVDTVTQRYRHEVCERYFNEIRSRLSDKLTRFHLVDEDFAIDNTVVDSKLEDLKRKIVEVASQQPYWGEEIPARWLPLEQELMRLRAAGIKVIHRNLLEDLNQTGPVQIATDELDLFLRFQHDIGTILYFSMEILKDKIVLDPQWMIDALKSLISAEMFVLRSTPAVVDKWFVFKKAGKLSPELIDAIWTKENNPDLHDNKEHILLLMERLNIIAKPRCYSEDGSEIKVESYFLAPCMLKEATPREVIFPEPKPEMESSSVLCYSFMGNFLPSPIFHRLLATCVAHWPIARKKSENLIYCGCCVFSLDLHHRLTVFIREHVIFARVTRMGTTEKTPSSKLCIEVREFITMTLSNVIGYLGQSLLFELFVQCPKSDGYSVDCLIPVADLQGNVDVPCHFHDNSHVIMSHDVLKFWFQEEDKEDSQQQQPVQQRESSNSEEDQEKEGHDDADTPITQDHINHARLCNALTTVCANALREILISQVPVSYADIYQALLANQANLTRWRQIRPGQWQKALLNKDQSKLVFPDPQGRFTGKIDQFDISLLYTLIRNVSSVQAPTTGWGNPPTDQPRDTSLGAGVERIRSYRNSMSGHSVDGKISQPEFEDYWNKIYDVLHDIENLIGNHDYQEKLEKRKNQVITPHEALELQKTFREYKEQVNAAAGDIRSAMETVQTEVNRVQTAVNRVQTAVNRVLSVVEVLKGCKK